MTPQEIISTARYILKDEAADYRQSDAELLEYVNEGIKEAVVIRPELFSTIGDYTCVAGKVEQSLNFADAAMLLEVLCIHDGDSVLPFDFAEMNAFNPGWRTDAAGPATNWAKFANDPLKFFVYPKAPANQVLDVRFVRIPSEYALTDLITDLPAVYKPALASFVVYRAESKDSEHVLSERAAAHYQEFMTLIKG